MHLVGFAFEPFKVSTGAVPLALPVAREIRCTIDHPVAGVFREIGPGDIGCDTGTVGQSHQVVLAFGKGRGLPGLDSPLGEAQASIGDDQAPIDADDAAKAAAGLAGTDGRVERKQACRWRFIADGAASAFECGRKAHRREFRLFEPHHRPTVAEPKCNFECLAHPGSVDGSQPESILNNPPQRRAVGGGFFGVDLGVPLRLEGGPDFVRAEVGRDRHRKAHNRPPPWGDFPATFRVLTERDQLLGRPLRRVASHHCRALTTMQGGGAGKEQFEMIIDLRHRPHGGAGRADRIGLIDCNRRRYALNAVDLGLVHAVEELARIGRECLDIAALPLGI